MNAQNIIAGARKGGTFGLLSGIILGVVGYVLSPPVDYHQTLVWKNKFGKKTRFTYLNTVQVLHEDLLSIYNVRSSNEDAFNEAFRNIQSVIAIYHPIKMGISPAGLMDDTRMTNYAKRANKALEAVLMSVRIKNLEFYEETEKSMMAIHLNLEEFINFVRANSKDALPSVIGKN